MKKSLIALAVLAAAGAASAQSSVTLFGIIDVGVGFGRGNVSNSTQVINSGGPAGSRIGFRGTEDLGGGMSAGFWLEAGVQPDNGLGVSSNTNNQASGASPAGGLTFNRRSTVSLAGGWGELRLGRDYTPQYWNLTTFDPFGTNGIGTTLTAQAGNALTGVTAVRASNSIGYFLPGNLGGFYGQFMHYRGENPSGTATSKDGTGNGIRVGFATGPFNVALAVSKTKYNAGDVKQNNLAGEWNFGIAKVQGQITKDANGSTDGKGWLLGGIFPVGAGEIKGSFSRYRTDLPGNPTSKKLAVGYLHNLSKRTALYTTVARVRNSGGSQVTLNGAGILPNNSATGLDIGMRHAF